jgi:TerC family integral membrane protein
MLWFWVGFTAFIVGMLLLDLGVFHNKDKPVTVKNALLWTGVWFSLASLFAAGVFIFAGSQKGMEFIAGYLLEQSLSLDNIFLFVLLFRRFKVPAEYQYRVLFWGVFGALVMRAIMILVGVELVTRFEWIIYIFGAFLFYTGVKMFFTMPDEDDIGESKILKYLKKHFRITDTYHGHHFTIIQDGKRYITPLLVVLILIEITDLIFAVDSIPAIFGVTTDAFIIYTSNCFAIMGLRSLYFALKGLMDSFHYLHTGLSVLLVFIGTKMLISFMWHPPVWVTLVIIIAILGTAILASLLLPKPQEDKTDASV